MNIAIDLTTIPTLLQPEVSRLWQDYLANASHDDCHCLAEHPQILHSLPKVWACSLFIAKHCIQQPALLTDLIDSGHLLSVPSNYDTQLQQGLPTADDEMAFLRVLRNYRRRELIRIAWRDLATWASLEETFQSLSNLADALLAAAVNRLYERLTTQWGLPCCNTHPQPFVVLALGKLGGQELNFSSDVDLIFAYPEPGETVGVARVRSNQEFFVRLAQQLIHALNHITEEGLVFRVDMRLRPFGDSGPLVMSFAAMEEYYQSHARDWERYALIKARVAAGDAHAGDTLLKMLQPFIYRRYLDYNAFESLRTMKALIDHETRLKGWESNIKLGSGGIREIEFICQCFQLIRGGRQPALQQRQLLVTLKQLEKYQLLSPEIVDQLREAYQFLRLTENHLQAIEDRQTQSLPQDILHQTRLAYSMEFQDWRSFMAALHRHQEFVHTQFRQVIAPPAPEETSEIQMTLSNHCQALWIQVLQEDPHIENSLRAVGFTDVAAVLEHLRQLVRAYTVQKLSKRGRERLDMLMPLLLTTVLKYPVPDATLHRTLNLVEAVALRSVYLALLIERPQVLEQLVRLCASSAWIAEQIVRYPLLLDELLEPRHLYDPLKPDELDNALQAQLAHLPTDDLEMQMDSMRQFKRAYVLQVAATEISGHLTVEVASDYLAAIADTLVRCALTIARDYLIQKHGSPLCNDNNVLRPAGFCVIAYGKAGGIELSYDSDLDIVFLHDSTGSDQYTDGTKPLDNNVYFSRLAQRIIHILNTNTPAGILYEVDPRLRPGGDSGLIVSSLDAFKTYQLEAAWTWEHQALVRARAMAGDAECIAKFAQIRHQVLSIRRQTEELRQEVREMRAKMREHLDKSTLHLFDLKQGLGGIADIEFIVQYGVLRWAVDYPQLLEKTAMLPILRRFAKEQLLETVACDQLSTAYRTYRTEAHRLALQDQAALVPADKFVKLREQVIGWWQKIIELSEHA